MKTVKNISILFISLFLLASPLTAQVTTQVNENNWYVGNTSPGEWIQFKKVWLSAGDYRFTTQAVAAIAGQTVRLELNGSSVQNGVTVPVVAGNAFSKVHLGHKTLAEGYYDVKLVFETGNVNCDMIFIRKSSNTGSAVLDDDTKYETNFSDGMHTFAIGGHANSTREMLNGTDPGADAVWKDPNGNNFSRAQVLGWNKQSIYNYNFPYTQETTDIYISEQVEAKVEVIFCHGRGEPDNTKQVADRAYETGPGGAPCAGLKYMVEAIQRNPYARNNIKVAYFADNAPFNLAIQKYLKVDQLLWGNLEHQEFIYNYAVKKFYQTVPRELLFFTPDGKVPMQWWTANSHVSYPSCGYELKEFLEYMVRRVKEDFDLDLALILSTTFFDRDSRTRDIAWGAQGWFSWSNMGVRTEIQELHGKKFAFALNGGRKPMKDNVLNDWNPVDNSGTFRGDDTHVIANYADGTPRMRQVYVDGHAQNAEWIVLEAWGDWREGSTWYRSHHSEYAFPNQYIALVREFADRNSGSILLEAEGCDEYHTVKSGNLGGAYRLNWYNDLDREIWDANLEAGISIFRPLHNLSAAPVKQSVNGDPAMKRIFAGLRDVFATRASNNSIYANEIDGYPVAGWSQLSKILTAVDVALGGNCAWAINTAGNLVKANLPNNQECHQTTGWEVKNSSIKIVDIDGSQSMLWGIDENHRVYFRDYEGLRDWTQVNGELTAIAADESFVWGFNPEGDIVRMSAQNRGSWLIVPNPHHLTKLSAGNYEVWGINAQNEVYRISSSGYGEWQHVVDGYADVSVGIDYVWMLNPQGVPYKYEVGGFQNQTVFNPENSTTNTELLYFANSVIVKENPFNDRLNIEIGSNADSNVSLQLFGIDGKLHVSKSAALQAGVNQVNIDNLSGLRSGIYILSVQGRTQSAKIKVIKK
ncbi:MAG: DUF5010 domain-containing protein [Dysgonamonadaceae bacterium]|jgi:hypothetical protein|nr:DUF5010 domain-containing protein [Dysgonamonadaceae bacterium]